MPSQFSIDQFEQAEERISPYIKRTPLIELKPGLLAKAEHQQVTGSFKIRGALNKMLSLTKEERNRGVVCASAGNHGLGVAFACELAGVDCTVVVPTGAVKKKVASIQKHGASLVHVAGGYGQAETAGRRLAEESGAVWISPYNDPEVVLGQGTIGLEIAQQISGYKYDDLAVFVPASGGGLLCGLGYTLRELLRCRLYGVQTRAAPYLHAQFTRGTMRDVSERPTLADGLAGPVEAGSITIEKLNDYADDILLVDEDDIVPTISWLAERGQIVEPSAAVAAAAALDDTGKRPALVVLSGGNLDDDLIAELQEGE